MFFLSVFAYVNLSHLNVEEGVKNVVFSLQSHITSNRHIVYYAAKFYKLRKLKANDLQQLSEK